METQLEEESMSRLNMIILGMIMIIIIAVLLDLIFGGETGFVRNIICGIVYYLPGGRLTSSYLGCASITV